MEVRRYLRNMIKNGDVHVGRYSYLGREVAVCVNDLFLGIRLSGIRLVVRECLE